MNATTTATEFTIPQGFKVVDSGTEYSRDFDGDNWPTHDYVRVYNPNTGEEMVVTGERYTFHAQYAIDTDTREEWLRSARVRREWCGWMENLRADRIGYEKGDMVQVFKGRKIPLGVYKIDRLGIGNYGPYADLRDASGNVHRYIAVGNFRHTPEGLIAVRKKRVLDNCPQGQGETVWSLLFPKGEYDGDKLPILCDYIEDGLMGEDVPTEAGRFIREQFCK